MGRPAPNICRDLSQAAKGVPSGTSPAAQFYTARAPVCMHVGMSVCVSERDLHPAPIAVPWSPLKPKDPEAGGHVHPQKDGPAPKLVSGPLGKELWSPNSQSMAWRGEHGHIPCAPWTAHPWGVAQPEKRELGPGLRTHALGNGVFPQPSCMYVTAMMYVTATLRF